MIWRSFRTEHTVSTVVPVVVSLCQVQRLYHLLLNVNTCFSSNFMSMLHMSKVCDILVNAILKNVEMSWFSSTGCSGNIPLIVRIYI